METTTLLVVGIAALVLIVLLVAWRLGPRMTQSGRLRRRFGSEYDRLVEELGSKAAAEKELAAREERVRGFEIHPLDAAERERFAASWLAVQAAFIDDPAASVADADRLVGELMEARGYPASDFDQRAADLSVDHRDVVADYRLAHEIGQREEQGPGRTEDLRGAAIGYRRVFNELLGESASATTGDRPAKAA